jgi:hypothetical protein
LELAISVLNQHPRSVKAALYVAEAESEAEVRQVGLEGALVEHRASRPSLAGAR